MVQVSNFRIERNQFYPITNSKVEKSKGKETNDFQKILESSIKEKDQVKISNHAQKRLLERDIKLQQTDMNLINKAMDDLKEKGAKESLMIYKDMAFIASVDNRTIITAMQNQEVDIVTNIDSTIIVK